MAAIGPAPPDTCWVHIGDRGSDVFTFYQACLAHNCQFLVRAYSERRVTVAPDNRLTHLPRGVATLVEQDTKTIMIQDSNLGSTLSIGFTALTIQAPFHSRHLDPIPAWLVRAWEANPPPDAAEPLNWILVTSVPTLTLAQAHERILWYEQRPIVED